MLLEDVRSRVQPRKRLNEVGVIRGGAEELTDKGLPVDIAARARHSLVDGSCRAMSRGGEVYPSDCGGPGVSRQREGEKAVLEGADTQRSTSLDDRCAGDYTELIRIGDGATA